MAMMQTLHGGSGRLGQSAKTMRQPPLSHSSHSSQLSHGTLSTELKSQAVTAFLYNLLNTRLGEGKPMIISTNLTTADAIVERYDERIGSRLLGEFLPYKFAGKDVRMLKLKKR